MLWDDLLTANVQDPCDDLRSSDPAEEGERGPDCAQVLARDAKDENLSR